MPQGEDFWNPYRWVKVKRERPSLQEPFYHHDFQGLKGFAECVVEALTPLFISEATKTGSASGQQSTRAMGFIKHPRTGKPFIPGTSLKGMIRSLFELLSNSAIPFRQGYADENHKVDKACQGDMVPIKLDPAARVFGYLNSGLVFRGLARFSDAHPVRETKEIGPFKVVVGQPRPETHKPFYSDELRRKFYHHHPNRKSALVEAPQNITQTASVRPLAPGCKFSFRVDFENLRQEELDLLIYCLELEDNVTVTLSPEALGPKFKSPTTFSGPMCHKLGGCKPHGAGSARIQITRLVIYRDIKARYSSQRLQREELTEKSLKDYLGARKEEALKKIDPAILKELRAMMIFSEQDPRTNIHYPDYSWFRSPSGSKKGLKPTV
ncbi:MAG: RAMP superfamily CRISPR-associated protein [Thermoguttaceae bacterium]|nr:RAMP superfamily CRISPR-associated protein [Thermoguttaceae bacterium]